MPGEPEPIYVLARRVLLDAFEALGAQRDAVILVGAQAIYLHTGAADLAVAEFTSDADIALDPALLKPEPTLGVALGRAGFQRDPQQPGIWLAQHSLDDRRVTVPVDLLVPEAVGGAGSRAARLEGHERYVARKVRGLEAVLVDRAPMTVVAFETEDRRSFDVNVAGPAALLVAKLHKFGERAANPRRSEDKDALDVLRILRAIDRERLGAGLRAVRDAPISSETGARALGLLREHFASQAAPGSRAAARAAEPFEAPDTIAASCAALATDLLRDQEKEA